MSFYNESLNVSTKTVELCKSEKAEQNNDIFIIKQFSQIFFCLLKLCIKKIFFEVIYDYTRLYNFRNFNFSRIENR